MRITCPACAASYDIRAEALGPAGRTVRCAGCGTKWFASPDSDDAPEPFRAVAEPEVLPPLERPAESPPRRTEDPTPATDTAGADGIEIAAARSAARRGRATVRRRDTKRGSGEGAARSVDLYAGWTVILVAAGLFAGALVYRETIVRALPDLAAVYAAVGLPVNLRGMEFRDLATRIDTDDGRPILVVEGRIDNLTDQTLAVPRLRLAIRRAEGSEVYTWAAPPPRPTIAPREQLAFRSRLTTLPPAGHDIEVRFLHAQDGSSGAAP